MGIVNVTPDSFSDGGCYFDTAKAIDHGLKLLSEGADMLDLGGESTRPGSHAGAGNALSTEEEQSRILPVLKGILRAAPDAILSVDTYKAATARAALRAGAEIINDVSGLLWDAQMAATLAELECGIVLMHTRGRPDEWRTQPSLGGEALFKNVEGDLSQTLQVAERAGIQRERIVLDPGYGFGKNFAENYDLLARQSRLLALDHPLLVGLSRKSFLGRTLSPLYEAKDAPPEARSQAGVTAAVAAILAGASIVRVHEVRAMVEAALIADALLDATP
jgi:dihydropteroate synthase